MTMVWSFISLPSSRPANFLFLLSFLGFLTMPSYYRAYAARSSSEGVSFRPRVSQSACWTFTFDGTAARGATGGILEGALVGFPGKMSEASAQSSAVVA